MQFHKRTIYAGASLKDYRSVFDQFERPRPNEIHNQNEKTYAVKFGNTAFTPETNCIVDSAVPIPKPKYCTDAFHSKYSQL